MNELWKSMPLALMFGLLLLHGCQGQEDSTTLSSSEPQTVTAKPTDEQSQPPELTTQSNYSDLNTATTNQQGAENITFSSNTGLQTNGTTPIPESKNNPADSEAKTSETSINIVEATVKEIHTDDKQNAIIDSGTSDAKAEADKDTTSGGSSSAVFVSVLLTGLLLAGIIVGIYYFKCHRRTNGKGMKLAEESYTADEENQGNTLVSVAPLNQPEPQEKPSLNGESQEAVKPQTPPAATNGHSTTKTADTEL